MAGTFHFLQKTMVIVCTLIIILSKWKFVEGPHMELMLSAEYIDIFRILWSYLCDHR